ncbi:tetrahydromethanopterin S-methyltransferase subunit F [Methanoculleus sp. FWC-SCC1]|uniref:Tetrahydromethanopterin S-methyltransferase subunit F n=1 Tax=Methanoculleus frigidifontis TaxID=2584085 RepID=A0ABT8MBF2_9EURY|nr:tetrahydromethanopterin S-methyltransferase subunit F [Methanoculleus sp. FWC-SCC1]MDN7025267.1 tetrahydromethanopterin S-methyltransferase subunit F [Methanoculleus sp. FWC-SCC1]
MAEEGTKSAGPIRMAAIDRTMGNIRYKAQIMARTNKLESGIQSGGLVGFAVGIIAAMLFILVPAVLLGAI